MIFDKDTAKKTAEVLLQINAIKLQPEDPFTWASGWKSPIYCDNRIVLSFPPIRNYIRETMAKYIEMTYGKPDAIAGVATGAIGIGILVAEFLGLPFIYVRPEAKKHGRQNQIEGFIQKGQNVVVVEDLISTGKSSLNAVRALKDAKVNVKGMVAIFTYGFKVAEDNFKESGITLNTLGNYKTLLKEAENSNFLSTEDAEILDEWRKDPANWDYNTSKEVNRFYKDIEVNDPIVIDSNLILFLKDKIVKEIDDNKFKIVKSSFEDEKKILLSNLAKFHIKKSNLKIGSAKENLSIFDKRDSGEVHVEITPVFNLGSTNTKIKGNLSFLPNNQLKYKKFNSNIYKLLSQRYDKDYVKKSYSNEFEISKIYFDGTKVEPITNATIKIEQLS